MDAWRAALAGLKTGQLKQEARSVGVDMSRVEEAIDEEDDPKSAIIALILSAAGAADEAAVRAELAQMKTGALRKRAIAVGADMGKVEAAIDEEDTPKAVIIELIVEAVASSGGGLLEGVPSWAALPEPELEPEPEPEPEPGPELEPGKLQLQVLPEGKRWHFFICHHQVCFWNLWSRVPSPCSA